MESVPVKNREVTDRVVNMLLLYLMHVLSIYLLVLHCFRSQYSGGSPRCGDNHLDLIFQDQAPFESCHCQGPWCGFGSPRWY